jgi:hypothetical protein
MHLLLRGSFHLVIPALALALSPHQEAGARLYLILHEGECSISGCSPQAARAVSCTSALILPLYYARGLVSPVGSDW